MRIVIVNSLYTPHIIGGAEISTQILAETLVSAADVHVLTVGGQKRSAGVASERINGVTVHRLPCNNLYWIGEAKTRGTLMKTARKLIDLHNPAQIRAVRDLLAAIKPDLIHTQNLSGFGAGIWRACAEAGVPVVHTLRDYSLLSPVSSPIASPLLSRIYHLTSVGVSKKVSAVVGISSHIMNRHTEAGLFPNAARLVIPNVVDGEIAGADKDFARKPLRIGFFGRVEAEKGVRELVDAIRSLPHEIVEQVTVCGEGGLRHKLLERCRHDDRFVFTGKVKPEEARKLMATVDVTFVPSIWEEPFGRVIIESYQVGTPVYASAVGGIPDAVWNPDDFLFQPGSMDAIKEKILAFYSLSGDEKKNIQQQCLKHCRGFTKTSLLEKHLDLYELTKEGRNRFMLAAAYGQVN
jgi:glycosyltransferase involved in cell wall biosynthesis